MQLLYFAMLANSTAMQWPICQLDHASPIIAVDYDVGLRVLAGETNRAPNLYALLVHGDAVVGVHRGWAVVRIATKLPICAKPSIWASEQQEGS